MSKLGPYDLNRIYLGDARTLSNDIPDRSINLIFTDPPYKKEFLYLYGWLGSLADRVLKDDGFLITYCGPYWKSKVIKLLDAKLEYFYDYIEVNNGNSTILWPKKTIARYKSLLAYRKKSSNGLPFTNVLGVWNGTGSDKRYHKWGQSINTALYYIDVFTEDEMIVLDPFMGGGTTAAACKKINVNYLGFEIDSDSLEEADNRLRNVHRKPMQMALISD